MVRWDPREIQAPGMGLDVRAHPPVDDALTHCSTQDPPPRVRWDPREIQAPGMGLDVRAHPPVDDPLTHCSTQDPPTQDGDGTSDR
jgi:hypothetical protein